MVARTCSSANTTVAGSPSPVVVIIKRKTHVKFLGVGMHTVHPVILQYKCTTLPHGSSINHWKLKCNSKISYPMMGHWHFCCGIMRQTYSTLLVKQKQNKKDACFPVWKVPPESLKHTQEDEGPTKGHHNFRDKGERWDWSSMNNKAVLNNKTNE